MNVIANLSVDEFQKMVSGFDRRYINHWDQWLGKCNNPKERVSELGRILRGWQAFRPNVMRRPRSEAEHEAPFLEDIIDESSEYIQRLSDFDIAKESSIAPDVEKTLETLWDIFLKLSFEGKKKTKRQGVAGVVGISKAVLLLTEGRVGPAFDSEVRKRLCVCELGTSSQWIYSLGMVAKDIESFQIRNGCTLNEAAPKEFRHIQSGRIYDMALGPRASKA